jgi:hypothetical protein
VSGCTHFGSRLAIYACNNVTVSDYSYSPNPACNVTRSVTDGYYITAPSESIAITNFTTSGQGGIISGSAATKKSCTDITIVNEVFTAPVGGNRIEIGAVDGLTITGGSFVNGTAQNSLYFAPAAPVSNVVVQGQGDTPLDLSDVRFLPQGHGATIEVTFENVSFPPLLIPPAGSPGALGSPSPTFRNLGGAGPPAPQVTVNGGMFTNTAVGAGFSQGVFQSPANTANYTITAYALNLGQAPVNLVAPQITTGSPPIVPNTTLTALKGAWSTAEEGSDTNTYSFQWSNQSGPVAGQTSPTYQVQIGDTTVTVTVTAANKDNPSLSASAASVPVTVS